MGKEEHLQAVKTETALWLEVPRRVILVKTTPDDVGKSPGGDAELRDQVSEVAVHLLQNSVVCSLGSIVSLSLSQDRIFVFPPCTVPGSFLFPLL